MVEVIIFPMNSELDKELIAHLGKCLVYMRA